MTIASKFQAWLKRAKDRPDPMTGLRDSVLRGWYNLKTGELFTGFAVGPGDVVADIGCGHGGNAGFCAMMGARLVLADIDPARVAAVAGRILDLPNHGEVEQHVTDADPLPLADGAVTRVICTEVIEHVDSPARLMAELARIGRSGAKYLLTCPDPAAEALQKRVAGPTYFAKPNHVRIIGHDEFARYVEDAGLIIESRHSYGFFWSMWLTLFWACDSSFEAAEESNFQEPHHPLLDNWTRTWQSLLDQPRGVEIKHALDDLMPKSQVIIARKP